MDESKLDYIRRRYHGIGIGSLVVGVMLVVLLVPRHTQVYAVGALVVLFGVFYTWAMTSVPRQTGAVSGLSETVGQHFQRMTAISSRITVPIFIGWIFGALNLPMPLTELQRYAVAFGGGWVIMFIGTRAYRSKCPRCHTDLWKERAAKLGRWSFDKRGVEELWNACPHCGMRFDERWSE
jgi:hypothetical protein